MQYDVLEGFWGDAGESIDAYYAVNDFVRQKRGEQAVIDGHRPHAAAVFEDERGWFTRDAARERACRSRVVQTNVSFSRRGVVRGLHFHQRGQDDLFACLSGTARVVVLDTESGEVFTEDIGDVEPGRALHPGDARARLRGAHRRPLLLPRHGRVRPLRPRRARDPLERPPREGPVEHRDADSLREGRERILITGAGGRLGSALARVLPGRGRPHARGVRHHATRRRSATRPARCSTQPRGRTWTAPRPTRRAPGP